MTIESMIGQVFGRLTVFSIKGNDSDSRSLCNCRCECGKEMPVLPGNLRKGNTKSCGCLRRESTRARKTTHGLRGSSEYQSWVHMRMRCSNENNIGFRLYGGRGITVCERWLNSFEDFLADMGPKPSSRHSLDRYPDVNGNYEPSNCRWANDIEQARNKRNNRWLELDGVRMLIGDWATQFGVTHAAIRGHMKRGKTFEQVVEFYSSKTVIA